MKAVYLAVLVTSAEPCDLGDQKIWSKSVRNLLYYVLRAHKHTKNQQTRSHIPSVVGEINQLEQQSLERILSTTAAKNSNPAETPTTSEDGRPLQNFPSSVGYRAKCGRSL